MPRLLLLGILLILPQSIAFAQEQPKQPPLAKIVVVEPKLDQQVSRTVRVRVKTEVPQGAAVPKVAYVRLGGTSWKQLEKGNGEWAAEIDSTLVPNGGQVLTVITENKKVISSFNVNVDNPLKIYFADLHSHTSYSDGVLTPQIAHDYARDTAELDAFCLTDHLESVDDAEWLDTREVAFDANEDGTFVAIPGLEWTKGWGHLNIYDPKTRHWPADPKAFYKAAADAGVVTKFNHPGDGSKTHEGLAYSEIGDRTVQLMEVRSNDEQVALVRALNNGWHLAPEGSDDTHSANWGRVRSWTGIYAPGLSKLNILDALSKRRCYSTQDRNCRLTYRIK